MMDQNQGLKKIIEKTAHISVIALGGVIGTGLFYRIQLYNS